MSAERVPCSSCGAMILPDTSDRCEGMCMNCYRNSPQAYAKYRRELKEAVTTRDYHQILTEGSSDFSPLTDKLLEEFQEKYSMTLPSDLLQLLRHQNGGQIENFALKGENLIAGVCGITMDLSDDRWLSAMIPVYDWLIIRGDLDYDTEVEEHKETLSKLLIIEGDGHYFITVDYRSGSEASGIVGISVEGIVEVAEPIEAQFRDMFAYW